MWRSLVATSRGAANSPSPTRSGACQSAMLSSPKCLVRREAMSWRRRVYLNPRSTTPEPSGILRHESAIQTVRILFYPQPPRPEAVVTGLCGRLGHEIVTDPGRPHDCAFFWTIRTIRRVDGTLARLSARLPVLNLACRDIGKRRVDRVFRSVFGYGSLVDPRTHHGVAVRKSNLNAQHDGRVVRCPPRAIRRTSVYQRLIDNTAAGNCVEDFRTPVFAGEIPFVYRIRKPIADRFGSPTAERIVETRKVFSPGEILHIQRFAGGMGLDYAELDILRDAGDASRLYV